MQKCHTRRSILAAGMIATGALGFSLHCGGGGNGGAPVASDPPPLADGGTAQSGQKPIPCDSKKPCTAGGAVMCCNGFCVDTSADPANCGQCGRSCPSAQFCDGTGCEDAVISSVCANPRGTVVLDPFDVDNAAGIRVGAALSSHCSPAPKIVQLAQDAGAVLDPGTGRPTTGVGNTFIAGGGAFGQAAIHYVELTASTSPVYLRTDGVTAQIVDRGTGEKVVDTMNAKLTAHHDFFYVQLTLEPQSGTLVFSVEGIEGPGTQAAGFYASSVIMPALSTFTKTWYVYEWTDTNNNGVADAGDTFALLGSG